MKAELADSIWDRLAEITAEALRMSEGESARFRASRVAKLIGLIPFLASCEDAERTALAHLGTYVMAGRGEARRIFDHMPADDAAPLARLRTISDFKGGDETIIERGMALLGLCMVSGYRRDVERDALLGEYNPLESGTWSAEQTNASFRSILATSGSADMDDILTLEQAEDSFWQTGYE